MNESHYDAFGGAAVLGANDIRPPSGRNGVVRTLIFPQWLGPGLSTPEVVNLAHVAAGLTDSETARTLDCSVGQVRYALRNAMTKLGARTRPEAVAKAIATGQLQVQLQD